MKKVIRYGLLTTIMLSSAGAWAEFSGTLNIQNTNGSFRFTGNIEMDIFESRKYGKKDYGLVEIELKKDNVFVDTDSNGDQLYLDGSGYQPINKTALVPYTSTSVNVTYCLHGWWVVDHPNTDINTALQPPGKQCITIRPAPRGEGGECALPTDCADTGYQDPLIIDLGHDGIHLGEAGVGIYFDMTGDGQLTRMQWVAEGGNEAFLVRDLNDNGVIDHGGELFGNGTVLALRSQISKKAALSRLQQLTNAGTYASDGFEALAQFDLPRHGGNGDGRITAKDTVWEELGLWLDSNADGVSTPDELMTLESVSIATLKINPRERDYRDEAGNWIPFWSWAKSSKADDKQKYRMVDVFFKELVEVEY